MGHFGGAQHRHEPCRAENERHANTCSDPNLGNGQWNDNRKGHRPGKRGTATIQRRVERLSLIRSEPLNLRFARRVGVVFWSDALEV